jgi:hypothetical protein
MQNKKLSIATVIAALTFVAVLTAHAEDDLVIRRQGSIEAGGSIVVCNTIDSDNSNTERFFGGKTVVDNIYATYQYPANQRYPYPILFNSGGGHTARIYDTTPDGREGWLTLFLRNLRRGSRQYRSLRHRLVSDHRSQIG